MSEARDQAVECAEAAMAACRLLLAFGPLVTPEQLYEVGETLRYTGSNIMGLRFQLQDELSKVSPGAHKPESPAMADLNGRQ